MALKRAELSNEVVVRLVELDGRCHQRRFAPLERAFTSTPSLTISLTGELP
jgi:hypothetical protein